MTGRPQARIGLLVGMLALASVASAQEPSFSGFLRLDRRLNIGGDSVTVADFYNRFRPELAIGFDAELDMVISLDVRFYDFSAVTSSDELASVERHFPSSASLWEALIRVSDLPVAGLDVTIGKQRVRWGTADELNPTDQFNAYDFSDLTDFTARIPVWAARFEYYVGEVRFDAVWVPTVHAPLLPVGGTALFTPDPAGARDHIEMPGRRLRDGAAGLRVSGYAAGFDLSLSVAAGYAAIPLPRRVTLAPRTADSIPEAWLAFPRTRTLGADFATEAGGVGLWGEAALVFPEGMATVTVTTIGSDTATTSEVALADTPYLKSTIGMDYTFSGGWYVNMQWAHGLPFESGAGNLHDYLMARIEKTAFRGGLQVSLGGALEVAQWSNISANLGYGFFPEITIAPRDNLDLVLGVFAVSGKGRSLLGLWDRADQAYLRFEVTY